MIYRTFFMVKARARYAGHGRSMGDWLLDDILPAFGHAQRPTMPQAIATRALLPRTQGWSPHASHHRTSQCQT